MTASHRRPLSHSVRSLTVRERTAGFSRNDNPTAHGRLLASICLLVNVRLVVQVDLLATYFQVFSNLVFSNLAPSTLALTLSALAVLAFATAARLRPVLRGTTLVPAAWWIAASVATVTGLELSLVVGRIASSSGWVGPLRFAVATTVFCPWMAVLGARRPHDRAWQWIVLSLWAILALPAAEVLLLQRGQHLEIHAARAWFLWLLIAVGVVNWLPTRMWGASLLGGAAQTLLLAEYLPGLGRSWGADGVAWALIAMIGAALWIAARARPRGEPPSPSLSRAWRDFRDLFGALWALRLLERISAAAHAGRWPVALHWDGFERVAEHSDRRREAEVREPTAKRDDESPHEHDDRDNAKPRGDASDPTRDFQPLQIAIDNLLRRFVDDEWLRERAGRGFANSDLVQ